VIAKDNDKALKQSCAGLLKDMCVKYDNLVEIDKLASVTKKVEVVRMVMEENVRIALENTCKIEAIQEETSELTSLTEYLRSK
jgi:type III secretory pathway component EscV